MTVALLSRLCLICPRHCGIVPGLSNIPYSDYDGLKEWSLYSTAVVELAWIAMIDEGRESAGRGLAGNECNVELPKADICTQPTRKRIALLNRRSSSIPCDSILEIEAVAEFLRRILYK